MEFKVSAQSVRIAPRKVRLVAGLIRNKTTQNALLVLSTCNKRAASVVTKLLKSAIANAAHTAQIAPELLSVGMIRVDGGPMLKRYDSRAMGRAEVIRKRISTIHLLLTDSPKSVKHNAKA